MAAQSLTPHAEYLQSPPAAVLHALAVRLRRHAAGIKNAAASRTIGKDLVAAAATIEHIALTLPIEKVAAAMVSYLGRDGFETWTGEVRS